MAEQMTDRREINAGFQQRHGRAVPHAVWMEPLLAQIRNVVSCALQALAKDVADAESRQRCTPMIEEDVCLRLRFWVSMRLPRYI